MVVLAATFGGIFLRKPNQAPSMPWCPLIQRRLTGQIAGMTGAYGNVGEFLPHCSGHGLTHTFFLVIGITAAIVLLFIAFFLRRAQGHMTECCRMAPLQLIEVH